MNENLLTSAAATKTDMVGKKLEKLLTFNDTRQSIAIRMIAH